MRTISRRRLIGHQVEVYAENIPLGLPPDALSSMTQGKPAMLSGLSRKDVTAFAFGAHFVEVRVPVRGHGNR